MARAHAIVVLCAIAAGSGLWLWLSQPEPIAPPLTETGTGAAPEPHTPDRATADRRAAESGAPPAAKSPGATATSDPADDGAAKPQPAPDAAPAPNVELIVCDLAGKQPVANFRWSYSSDHGDNRRGTGAEGRATFAASPQAQAVVDVEADGLRTKHHSFTTSPPGAPMQRVEVFLEPIVESSITITARGPGGLPVRRLRIDLWRLAAEEAEPQPGEDPPQQPLWKRGADTEDGICRLPSLDDGRYLLRVQPISPADDTPLPLQPQRRCITYYGHMDEPLTMDFVPGIVLRLEAAPDGGKERQCDIVVSSRNGPLRTIWRSITTSGRTVVGYDTVMCPGMATTLLALPVGDYIVTGTCEGQPVALLPQGEIAGQRTFTVQLPR